MRYTERLAFRVTKRQKDILKKVAKKQNKTIGEIIRELVSKVV